MKHMKYTANRWISATGILLFGLASCIWAISQWRAQELRSRQLVQEHLLKIQEQQLKERILNEERERQTATLDVRRQCDAEAEQRAVEKYNLNHPKYGDKIVQGADGNVIQVIPNGVTLHDDGVFLTEDYETYYQQCVRLAGAE